MIERMETESITLPMQRVVQSENGVYFYTAHGAKGNEFEYVFLIGCTTGFWEKKKSGMGTFSLPDTLTATTDDVDSSYKVEVARRLYYVALTRARKHLYISYALNDNNGKGLEPSAFIDEIAHADGTNRIVLSTEQILKHIEWALTPVPDVRIRTTNAQWIDRNLQQFVMSATQLNKFLRCPLSFYYETILRVPFQKSDALSFGTAIHYALERLYLDRKLHDGTFPPKENVIAAFKSEMYRELASFTHIQFERRMEQGETILSDYYDHYLPTLHTQVEIEFKIPRYQLDGVPVTGKIDKIEMHGDTCTVIDYKTGNAEKSASKYLAPPNEKDPLGGEYWRQMVFYKLIIENYDDRNWHVNTGKFDYVQKTDKGEFKQYTVPVFEADELIVRHQLKDAYTRIMNHEFDKGCGDENCHWCNFAKRYQLIRTDDDTEMDDDE
jgi:DNA helicase-2/ATP-dependent DNA helicase PcrA